jgi:N6-L-threonylcarbamoyladenine synthase
VADICAGFQQAVADIVAARARDALSRFSRELPDALPVLVVAGGVAANQAIAVTMKRVAAEAGARLVVPPIALCTDNGAMVAWAGAERLALGDTHGFDVAAKARWPLDSSDMERRHVA